MTKNDTTIKDAKSTAALYAGTVGITIFWLLIIMKNASADVKEVLNFYPPVGPLLGGFVFGLIGFVIAYFVVVNNMKKKKKGDLDKHERTSSVLFVISCVLIFFMTFPPIFEPIAEIFH